MTIVVEPLAPARRTGDGLVIMRRRLVQDSHPTPEIRNDMKSAAS